MVHFDHTAIASKGWVIRLLSTAHSMSDAILALSFINLCEEWRPAFPRFPTVSSPHDKPVAAILRTRTATTSLTATKFHQLHVPAAVQPDIKMRLPWDLSRSAKSIETTGMGKVNRLQGVVNGSRGALPDASERPLNVYAAAGKK